MLAGFALPILELTHRDGRPQLNVDTVPDGLEVAAPTRHRRRLLDQFHLRHDGTAQVCRAHPEPLALLSSEGRRQRAADTRRHCAAGHPDSVRLRNLDQPHHTDLSGRHHRDPGPFQRRSDMRGDSPASGHRVVLRQHAIDDADGRPRFPRIRPELVTCRLHRRRGVAVPARRRVRGTHRRKDSAVLRIQRDRPAQRNYAERLAGTSAAYCRQDSPGDVGPSLRRRTGRHRLGSGSARMSGSGDQPRLSRRHRPRSAVHPRRLDADGRHLRDRSRTAT